MMSFLYGIYFMILPQQTKYNIIPQPNQRKTNVNSLNNSENFKRKLVTLELSKAIQIFSTLEPIIAATTPNW